MDFLRETEFLGNDLGSWLIAATIAIGTYVALRLVMWALQRWVHKYTQRTSSNLDNILVGALGRTKKGLLAVAAIFAGSLALQLSSLPETVLHRLAMLALLAQVGFWSTDFVGSWITDYRSRQLETDPGSVTGLAAVGFMLKLAIWVVILLLALDNLGVNITALATGLGIGGIAVALALQSILGDLFASLSIMIDKPFVIGDYVKVGEFGGNVEMVGLKTTRVRSLTGEQLIFANSDLLKSRLQNFGRMYERRGSFQIGIVYETPREVVAKVPDMIREIVEAQDKARFDRSHFKELGDFALIMEAVYHVTEPAYATYMDIQQAINEAIMERFEQEGIEFAYPTQLLYTAEAKPA